MALTSGGASSPTRRDDGGASDHAAAPPPPLSLASCDALTEDSAAAVAAIHQKKQRSRTTVEGGGGGARGASGLGRGARNACASSFPPLSTRPPDGCCGVVVRAGQPMTLGEARERVCVFFLTRHPQPGCGVASTVHRR